MSRGLLYIILSQSQLTRYANILVEPPYLPVRYAILCVRTANYPVEPPAYTYTICHTVCANSECSGETTRLSLRCVHIRYAMLCLRTANALARLPG